jgi:hypothetical protein
MNKFTCDICGQQKTNTDSITPGYGVDKAGKKVCFACCAEIDKQQMRDTGRAVLYFTIVNNRSSNYGKVTNWPGTLVFDHCVFERGRHNFARTRYDVWFSFDGYWWHGVNYGEFTQLCYCKRTKERAAKKSEVA